MQISLVTRNIAGPTRYSLPVKGTRLISPRRLTPEHPGKLIYTMVHEIRNPLTNIKLAAEVMKQMSSCEDKAIYLDIIMRNSARINDIVTDLLTQGKTGGKEPGRYSVRDIIDEVLSMNNDRIILNDVTVRKNYSTRDPTGQFCRSTVKIALTNIIINAIEAMPAGNAQLQITTKLLRGICYIVIEDNGTGITQKNLDTLFKPYFTSKPDGIGLGLSGTRAILDANNIAVYVRSEEKKGTKFILSFRK